MSWAVGSGSSDVPVPEGCFWGLVCGPSPPAHGQYAFACSVVLPVGHLYSCLHKSGERTEVAVADELGRGFRELRCPRPCGVLLGPGPHPCPSRR